MTPLRHTAQSRQAHARLWALLAAVLLLAQAAGLWHRTAHAVPAAVPAAMAHATGTAHVHGQHSDHDHHPAGEHAAGDSTCTLLDHLLGADAAPVSQPTLLPAPAPAAVPLARLAARAGAAPAHFQARGPPAAA